MQDHRDIFHSISHRRGRETVHGLRGKARLEARCSLIIIDELIGVGKAEFSIPDAVHPNRRILADAVMGKKLPRHQRDVVGRGVVIVVIEQSRAVFEMRVVHAEFGSSFIHLLYEGILRAA